MFKFKHNVSINKVKSNIEELKYQFLKGDNLSVKLSQYVSDNIEFYSDIDYMSLIKDIKRVLNQSEILYRYDVMIVKTKPNLSEIEKAAMVRFINLCIGYKQKILVINDEIVYTPESVSMFSDTAVEDHVKQIYSTMAREKLVVSYIERFKNLFRQYKFAH